MRENLFLVDDGETESRGGSPYRDMIPAFLSYRKVESYGIEEEKGRVYTLFRLANRMVPCLPRRSIVPLSWLIGTIAWAVARSARKQATTNMKHVLGHSEGARVDKAVRGMFRYNVRNYLETFKLSATDAENIVASIKVDGIEHLEAALALGKGVILFSAHLGPFNYMSQWLAIKGYQTIIPVEQLSDPRVLALILNLRRSYGVQYVPLGGSAPMRKMIAALRSNQLVLITADRAVQGDTIEVPFFGTPARLPIGPIHLAQRTGAVLVGAFGWWAAERDGQPMHGYFVPVSLELPEEHRIDTDSLIRSVVAKMEHCIREHPEQWTVFSSVWTGV